MIGEHHAWQPHIIDPATSEGREQLALRLHEDNTILCDTFCSQLDDLLASRHPRMSGQDREHARRALLGDAPAALQGRWVYYPWANKLVHTLPPELFREARLARNREKITAAEQARLARCTAGIVGLSVGRQIARTLAMEGICTGFRLADADVLSLSNLNRLPAGITELGVPKVVLAARELFELDPYLDIEIFPRGVSAQTMDDFLAGQGRALDLAIEECDDLAVKIGLRERLRALGIPVLMETSERGTLDVERFDLEPNRPLLHGLLEGVRPEDLRDVDRARALVLEILPDMRPRTRESVLRVGKTLKSWPQLASEIALGAATVATAARAILLGEPVASGRYHVDLEALVPGMTGAGSRAPEPDRNWKPCS